MTMSGVGSETKKLDGRATAKAIRAEVAAGVAALAASREVTPGLTVLIVGEDPASQVYVRNKARMAEKVGMRSALERLPAETDEATLLERVAALNADPSVHGILVQLPLPKQIDADKVLLAIDPAKDVDAFHPVNVGRMTAGLPGFLPCTPAGVIELLRRHEIEMKGKHAVVVGRSNIVGKPMALLLLREHCTVTICHSRTTDLAAHTREADILVAAAGVRAMIGAEHIRPGAVVVDVGIHRVEDEASCRELFGDDAKRLAALRDKGATLVGDVHPAQADGRAGWFSPVPGGVGPLTIAMLMHNTLVAARRSVGLAG